MYSCSGILFSNCKSSDMCCEVLQGCLLSNCLQWPIVATKRSDKSSAILQEGYLLMLRNRVFWVRNVEEWAVLSSNEVDLPMLRNRVFRLLKVQKCAVPSRKGLDLLMFRNRAFRLRNDQIWSLLSWKDFFLLILRNCVLRLGIVAYELFLPAM